MELSLDCFKFYIISQLNIELWRFDYETVSFGLSFTFYPAYRVGAKYKIYIYSMCIILCRSAIKIKNIRTESFLDVFLQNFKNQLHAVSRTQQVRQREPSIKTLRSPLSAEFWRHCVLSGRTQRRT